MPNTVIAERPNGAGRNSRSWPLAPAPEETQRGQQNVVILRDVGGEPVRGPLSTDVAVRTNAVAVKRAVGLCNLWLNTLRNVPYCAPITCIQLYAGMPGPNGTATYRPSLPLGPLDYTVLLHFDHGRKMEFPFPRRSIGCHNRAHQDASPSAPHFTFDQIAEDVVGQYRLHATLQTDKSLHPNHRVGIRGPV